MVARNYYATVHALLYLALLAGIGESVGDRNACNASIETEALRGVLRQSRAYATFLRNQLFECKKGNFFSQDAIFDVHSFPQEMYLPSQTVIEPTEQSSVTVDSVSSLMNAVQNAPKDHSTQVTIHIVKDLDFSTQITVSYGQIINFTGPVGGSKITLNGQNKTRLFYILTGASASFSAIRFHYGHISDQDGGGALSNYGTISRIKNCIFRGNSASQYGGAVGNQGHIGIIEQTSFSMNSAPAGAAIYNTISIHRITGCNFTANFGSGSSLYNFGSLTAVEHCAFFNNSGAYGADIYHVGSNILILSNDFKSATRARVAFGKVDAFLIDNTNLDKSMFNVTGTCGSVLSCPIGHRVDPDLSIPSLYKVSQSDVSAWTKILCKPCPENEYQAIGQNESTGSLLTSCKTCPMSTSTHGRIGASECSPCGPFYTFSRNCATPVLGIILGILVSIIFSLIGAVAVYSRRYYRAIKKENADLKDSWYIDPASIDFGVPVAKGSFGKVYRGKWDDLEVAIKELIPTASSFETDGSMWLDDNEVSLMLRLRHPRIVRFHGGGTRKYVDHVRHYMVYEWMQGGSLRGYLNDRRDTLSWSWRVGCAKDIALGIKFLHDKNFVHRDIKTDNVLLDDKGRAKLGDFGTGRAIWQQKKGASAKLEWRDRLFGPDAIMTAATGTPMYMAPELLAAHFERRESHIPMSFKTDIYAFGIVMWELHTCRIPYDNIPSTASILREIMGGTRPEVTDSEKQGQKGAFADIFERCWAGVAADRPDISSVLHDISDAARQAQEKRIPGSRSSMTEPLLYEEL